MSNVVIIFYTFLKIWVIIMARKKSQRKFGLPRATNLPFNFINVQDRRPANSGYKLIIILHLLYIC